MADTINMSADLEPFSAFYGLPDTFLDPVGGHSSLPSHISPSMVGGGARDMAFILGESSDGLHFTQANKEHLAHTSLHPEFDLSAPVSTADSSSTTSSSSASSMDPSTQASSHATTQAHSSASMYSDEVSGLSTSASLSSSSPSSSTSLSMSGLSAPVTSHYSATIRGDRSSLTISEFVFTSGKSDAAAQALMECGGQPKTKWVRRKEGGIIVATANKNFLLRVHITDLSQKAALLFCGLPSGTTGVVVNQRELDRTLRVFPCGELGGLSPSSSIDLHFRFTEPTYRHPNLELEFLLVRADAPLPAVPNLAQVHEEAVLSACTDPIEVISSTTWRNRYENSSSDSPLNPSSGSSSRGGSTGSSSLAVSAATRAAQTASVKEAEAVIQQPIARKLWLDEQWHKKVEWRIFTQTVARRFSLSSPDWLKNCIGGDAASTLEPFLGIDDYNQLWNNLATATVLTPAGLRRIEQQFFCYLWFCGFGDDRYMQNRLRKMPRGCFLVRFSQRGNGQLAIVVKNVEGEATEADAAPQSSGPGPFLKYLIKFSAVDGYEIAQGPKTPAFHKLGDLIEYYCVEPLRKKNERNQWVAGGPTLKPVVEEVLDYNE